MTYIGLGPRAGNAAPDTTGRNPGNWTNSFLPADFGVHVPWFECYHITLNNAPSGAQATIYIGTQQFSFVQAFTGQDWDPSQPMLLQDGSELYFFWNAPASGTPPRVTVWLRYDPGVLTAAEITP